MFQFKSCVGNFSLRIHQASDFYPNPFSFNYRFSKHTKLQFFHASFKSIFPEGQLSFYNNGKDRLYMSFCQQWRLNTSNQLWPNENKIQTYNFPGKKAFCMNVFCFFPIISVQEIHLWKYWNYVIGICFTAILFPQLCNKKAGIFKLQTRAA